MLEFFLYEPFSFPLSRLLLSPKVRLNFSIFPFSHSFTFPSPFSLSLYISKFGISRNPNTDVRGGSQIFLINSDRDTLVFILGVKISVSCNKDVKVKRQNDVFPE